MMSDQRTPRGPVRLLAGATAAMIIGACGLQPDSSPRDVNPDQRDPIDIDAATVLDAAGDTSIFLVAPTEPGQLRRIRSVQRDALASPTEVLKTLFDGPSQRELDTRYISAIPSGTTLRSARRASNVLYVDISSDIDNLTDEALILALGQIVFTASEIPQVQLIRLRVDGEDRPWPRGDGQSRIGDLQVHDFPGLAETVQPPFPAIRSNI
jgi:hypothetical protein